MIWTGSDLALLDAGVNFKKIPCFHEVTMWNAQEMCEDIVQQCTAASVVACIFPICILIKVQDWVKHSQNRTDEVGSFDYLNKLVYKIFRSFIKTWVTFWKHNRLKKPACYWLPMRLGLLSHFSSVGNASPGSLKKKDFNKCKISSISFLLEKNLYEYKILHFWSVLRHTMKVLIIRPIDFRLAGIIFSSGFVITEEMKFTTEFHWMKKMLLS